MRPPARIATSLCCLLDSDLISHQYLSRAINLASYSKLQAFAGRPYIVMAEASGVTEADLKAKITERLQATHVEIEDMSGISTPPAAPPFCYVEENAENYCRWLWPSFLGDNRLTAV
jgi:hypothetical protein